MSQLAGRSEEGRQLDKYRRTIIIEESFDSKNEIGKEYKSKGRVEYIPDLKICSGYTLCIGKGEPHICNIYCGSL